MSQEKRKIPTHEQILDIFVKFDGKPRERFEYLVNKWIYVRIGIQYLRELQRNSGKNLSQEIQMARNLREERKLEIDQIRTALRSTYSSAQVNQLFHLLASQANFDYSTNFEEQN